MEKTKHQREMALLQAAFDGNLGLIKKMARGLDGSGRGEAAVVAAAVQSSTGNGVLHLAAMEGRVDVCRYLVQDLCLDINQRNNTGNTPLFLSAFFGRAAAARYLLDHGADVTLTGQCEVLELLLSRGINVDLNARCGTPLHTACTHGRRGTMKILLDSHADPNKVLNLDDTPLEMVIRCFNPTDKLECVKLLIKAGADVNFIGSNGATYVMTAVDLGLPGILKSLLDTGTNPNISDDFGRTPIEVAALRGREFVEMLFPLTFPISTFPDWSIDGIISHVKSCGLKPRAMQVGSMEDDDNATLLANRSLCMLRLGSGNLALSDANMCRMFRPRWPKACYRQGAAFMLLKDYSNAHKAYADGLKLEPTNVDLQRGSREALEAMENARRAEE
ncbi:hypothetical protein BRADI_2g13535v3 [Brachypodium distachyon]|uniref:Uncharacterized protein n=1 Tax=Brachypodium distachyon TaxID=15368 RepID=A0A2K2D8C9_BRADI|nr:hypothetical protein BRADI_2g13535v3 [Brachypodium distachyon]